MKQRAVRWMFCVAAVVDEKALLPITVVIEHGGKVPHDWQEWNTKRGGADQIKALSD